MTTAPASTVPPFVRISEAITPSARAASSTRLSASVIPESRMARAWSMNTGSTAETVRTSGGVCSGRGLGRLGFLTLGCLRAADRREFSGHDPGAGGDHDAEGGDAMELRHDAEDPSISG